MQEMNLGFAVKTEPANCQCHVGYTAVVCILIVPGQGRFTIGVPTMFKTEREAIENEQRILDETASKFLQAHFPGFQISKKVTGSGAEANRMFAAIEEGKTIDDYIVEKRAKEAFDQQSKESDQ